LDSRLFTLTDRFVSRRNAAVIESVVVVEFYGDRGFVAEHIQDLVKLPLVIIKGIVLFIKPLGFTELGFRFGFKPDTASFTGSPLNNQIGFGTGLPGRPVIEYIRLGDKGFTHDEKIVLDKIKEKSG
jgi:hypothetical protein